MKSSSPAFLGFLRANLVLEEHIDRHYGAEIRDYNPLAATSIPPMPTLADEDGPAPLVVDLLNTPEKKEIADKMLEESVTEIQYKTARYIFAAPRAVLPIGAILIYLHRYFDSSTPITHPAKLTSVGILVVYAIFVWIQSYKYTLYAELVLNSWFKDKPNNTDLLVGVRLQGTVVGIALLRIIMEPHAAGKRKVRNANAPPDGRGFICAWLVSPKHRGSGVGRELLRAIVTITRECCGKDATLTFARQHIHSPMVLPEFMTGALKRDEARAARSLRAVMEEPDEVRGGKKK